MTLLVRLILAALIATILIIVTALGIFYSTASYATSDATHEAATCDEAGLQGALTSASVDPALATVTFPPACTGITLTLPNLVNYDVIIDGGGVVTLQFSGTGRHFLVDASGDLTLRNIAITGGNSPTNGGAVRVNGGKLLIQNARFTQNHSSNGDGGAIYVVGGEATVVDSAFEENSASTHGGAIATSNSPLTVARTQFISNTASTTTTVGFAWQGGAIFNSGPVMLTISESNFLGNGVDLGRGGAVAKAQGTAIIDRSHFSGNYAGLTTSTSVNWGGALSTGNMSSLMIQTSTFENNYAAGRGGAIASSSDMIRVLASDFASNVVDNGTSASDQGGAIWAGSVITGSYIYDTHFQGNFSGNSAGAVYLSLSADTNYQYPALAYSSFVGNTATIASAVNFHSIGARPSPVQIESLTFHGNHVPGGANASLRFNNTDAELRHVTITDNESGVEMASANTLVIFGSVLDNTVADCQGSSATFQMDYSSATGAECVGGGANNLVDSAALHPIAPNNLNTWSRLPIATSAIVDVIPSGLCSGVDQRNVARPQNTNCDMGAIEVAPADYAGATATAVAATATASAEAATATSVAVQTLSAQATATVAAQQTATSIAQTATAQASLTPGASATPTPTSTPTFTATPESSATPPTATPQATVDPQIPHDHFFYLNPVSGKP